MWRHLPDDEAAAAEQMVADGRPSVLDGDPGVRWFHVDGEFMAEGGVEQVLRDMATGLRTYGVELHIETVNSPIRVDDGDYVVAINGHRCLVWRPDDWAADPWKVSTVRPLTVVNDLLAEANAPARLFTIGAGGNEAIAWLVEPRIVAAIADSGLVGGHGLPALASND
jgi:hypothetical protein